MSSKNLFQSIGYEFISVCIIHGDDSNDSKLKERLRSDDYRVESAGFGSEAALRFLETRINVAQILLPVDDFEENFQTIRHFIGHIRALRNYKHKPITLLFSSFPTSPIIEQCLSFGCVDWHVLSSDQDLKALKNKIQMFVALEKDKLTSANFRFPRSAEYQRSALNENRFLAAFDHGGIAFFMMDLTGHFIEINTTFEKLTGYSSQDILMKNLSYITDAEDLSAELDLMQKMLKKEIPGYTIEKRLIHKTGKTLWVHASIFLVRDEVGTPVNILANLDDITARKNAEEGIAQAQKNLMTERKNFWDLLSQTPELVCVLSGPRFEFESANEAYAKILNRDPIGQTIYEVQPESTEIHNVLQKVFASEKTVQLRELEVTIRNEKRYFNLTCSIRRSYDGNVTGVMLLGSEVSAQVYTREELKSAKITAETASAAKTAFLANMSHEIRTPLGVIMGFMDLMKQADLNRYEFTQYLSIMERNSNQLSRLVDDILDLSKVEAGKMAIENINFSLTDFMADFCAMMSFKAQENGILFRFVKRNRIPDTINSDPLRLRQILINAVGNAIKFTQKGEVALELTYEQPYLSFYIIDTGRGISSVQAQNLFQVFSQADPSTTRKFGGTGLGLALSRSLCQMLGGNYTLEESVIGKGSTFLARVYISDVGLKNADSARSSQLGTKKTDSSRQNILQGMRILLVEDMPDNQVLISLILRTAGAVVEIAQNGMEGVKKALSQNYDVILMDIQMPIMDGHEATRTLRKQGYQGPIIALTAHAMKEEEEQTKLSGFSYFMTKPIRRTKLIAGLQQIGQK